MVSLCNPNRAVFQRTLTKEGRDMTTKVKGTVLEDCGTTGNLIEANLFFPTQGPNAEHQRSIYSSPLQVLIMKLYYDSSLTTNL